MFLFAVAGRTRWALPEQDTVARWDGGTFLLVISGEPEAVAPTLELITDKVNTNPIRCDAGLVPTTVSSGAAAWPDGTDLAEAVGRARRALLLGEVPGARAPRAGRLSPSAAEVTRTRRSAAARRAWSAASSLPWRPPRSAEEISELRVAAVVSADTTMTLTETIAYDFTPNARHGIYRDIPLFDELVTGDERHYGVEVASVRMDGAAVPYETGVEGSYLRVRIGDPEEFVTGSHEYVIEYRVTGALQSMSAADAAAIGGQGGDAELYWDFVGNGWGVPIANARATLDGPVAPMAVGCFFGPYGADTSCPAVTSGATVSFGPVELGRRVQPDRRRRVARLGVHDADRPGHPARARRVGRPGRACRGRRGPDRHRGHDRPRVGPAAQGSGSGPAPCASRVRPAVRPRAGRDDRPPSRAWGPRPPRSWRPSSISQPVDGFT